tara:strand:- start:445 stop:1083 length:639 start_codon:yes stop_codon:yes gene_type:complete
MKHITSLFQKYSVAICIIFSAVLITIATFLYPGGSLLNTNAVGFDWTKNFISNLFEDRAINGSYNPGKIWAIVGMAFHSIANGLFFIHMAKKFSIKQVVLVLKTVGYANMVSSFLIVTRLHDIMVIVSATLSLVGFFYITIFIFKTKLHLLKMFCTTCLIIFYFTLYLYGTGNWGLLAIMQKVSFVSFIVLVLSLEYATHKDDFDKSIDVTH